MEAVGAVASIIQVAQFGTQLSIGLYQIADCIASANQETNYIAKDIALFCHVLKDLAKALEFGQKAQLFRQNAFDTSLKIVDECKHVFNEIEVILKKVTKSDNPLAGKFRLPHGQKIMWIFRKGKVEFFRSLLGSLKSTILVELAVLNYAVKVTSHLTKDTVDADELLALKSLVLASETAKQELQDVATSNGEILDELHISSNGVSSPSKGSNRLLTSTSAHDGKVDGGRGAPPSSNGIQNGSTSFELASTHDVSSASGVLPYWSQTDRLELAAQKLELAKWEYQRLEENIALNKQRGSDDDQMRQEFLMNRVKDGLTKFGMREDLIMAAMSILQADENETIQERTAVYPIIPLDMAKLDALAPSGLVMPSQENNPKASIVMRWLPDIFVDILYEHTQDLLEKSGYPRQRSRLVSLHGNDQALSAIEDSAEKGLTFKFDTSPQETISSQNRKRQLSIRDEKSNLDVPEKRRHKSPDNDSPIDMLTASVHLEDSLNTDTSTAYPEDSLDAGIAAGHADDIVMEENPIENVEEPEPIRPNHAAAPANLDENTARDDTLQSSAVEQGSFDYEPDSVLQARIPSPSNLAWGFPAGDPLSLHISSNESIIEPAERNPARRLSSPNISSNESAMGTSGEGWNFRLKHLMSTEYVPSIQEQEDFRKLAERNQAVEQWVHVSDHRDQLDIQSATQEARERPKFPLEGISDSDSQESIGDDTGTGAPQNQLSTKRYEDAYQPSGAQMPLTANAAMQLFASGARDVETFSQAATWGSKSEDGEYDLIAYMRRRKHGIEGRKKFFQAKNEDKSMQVVQELLLKWTVVDEPATVGNKEQQKRQGLLMHAGEELD